MADRKNRNDRLGPGVGVVISEYGVWSIEYRGEERTEWRAESRAE